MSRLKFDINLHKDRMFKVNIKYFIMLSWYFFRPACSQQVLNNKNPDRSKTNPNMPYSRMLNNLTDINILIRFSELNSYF